MLDTCGGHSAELNVSILNVASVPGKTVSPRHPKVQMDRLEAKLDAVLLATNPSRHSLRLQNDPDQFRTPTSKKPESRHPMLNAARPTTRTTRGARHPSSWGASVNAAAQTIPA